MSTLEKVKEVCRLRPYMPDCREFVETISDIFGARPLQSDRDNLYHFLATIHNAGRIEGIRQERNRRKRQHE